MKILKSNLSVIIALSFLTSCGTHTTETPHTDTVAPTPPPPAESTRDTGLPPNDSNLRKTNEAAQTDAKLDKVPAKDRK